MSWAGGGHVGPGIADERHPRIPWWRVVHVEKTVGCLLRRPIGQLLIGKVEKEITLAEVVPSADRQRSSDIRIKSCAIDAQRPDRCGAISLKYPWPQPIGAQAAAWIGGIALRAAPSNGLSEARDKWLVVANPIKLVVRHRPLYKLLLWTGRDECHLWLSGLYKAARTSDQGRGGLEPPTSAVTGPERCA